MLAFVFISFHQLSPLQLVETKIRGSGRWKIRRWTAGLRTTLQIVCVGAKRKMHPFLLLKMLFLLIKLPLSFVPVSLLRYVQSGSVVVVTINKLDFESSVWSL